jgi:hypothetical protein
MNVEREVVASMIPTLFLPFNLTKATLNSSLVLILYKPVSKALKAANVLPQKMSNTSGEAISKEELKRKKRLFNLVVTLVGLAVALLCLAVIFFVLGGELVVIGH